MQLGDSFRLVNPLLGFSPLLLVQFLESFTPFQTANLIGTRRPSVTEHEVMAIFFDHVGAGIDN